MRNYAIDTFLPIHSRGKQLLPQMARYPRPSGIPSLIIILSQCLLISATCYREDNHMAMSSIYTPCNTNTPYSMCTRSQVDSLGDPPDTKCLPNGLILSPDGGGQFWRQGCTDQSWQSEYCLNAFNACPAVRIAFLSAIVPVVNILGWGWQGLFVTSRCRIPTVMLCLPRALAMATQRPGVAARTTQLVAEGHELLL
jgi:hypothetical protein